MKKHFEHDSDCCLYLGSSKTHDFYTCVEHGPRVFLARFGNDPQDYGCVVESDLAFTSPLNPTKVAYFMYQVHEAEVAAGEI